MITIKILGTGCAKCKTLHAKVSDLVAERKISAAVTKVEDIQEILKYGILSTPGLVVNEKVKSAGFIPKDEQIISWIAEG